MRSTITQSLLLCTMVTLVLCKTQFMKDNFEELIYQPEEFRIREHRTVREVPLLPKRSQNDESKVKRLQIDRKTGFDGSVKAINVESPEEVTDVKAYELSRENQEDNGFVERIEVENVLNDESRNGRLVEAYGMSKRRLENNGYIERVPLVDMEKIDSLKNAKRRARRSSDPKTSNEIDDLEAQDAKVFRPLFVYRQQVAKRQKYKVPHYGRQPYLYYPWERRHSVY